MSFMTSRSRGRQRRDIIGRRGDVDEREVDEAKEDDEEREEEEE